MTDARVVIASAPGPSPAHVRLLQRIGISGRAQLARANITLLVARVRHAHEVEGAETLGPSASMISDWVRRARYLNTRTVH